MQRSRPILFRILAVSVCLPLLACKAESGNRPQSQELPPFNPHRTDFICTTEANKVPPIDAQAEAWLQQAQALEDPSIYVDDRDYKRIVSLTRQAAERHHWKAMLNLASLYLENRDPPQGNKDALTLVEDAMRLGIPAAYERMGSYYLNATGVNGDSTKAYAFFQRAAEMGNPQAMTYLGKKLVGTWDSPKDGFWANIPVARKMLECAFSQGYGPAAYHLAAEYQDIVHAPTAENNERALKTLHEGVKLGCSSCANRLSIEFGDPIDTTKLLVPSIDKARAERYSMLGDALSFNPNRRFHDLDKVLPLPPAKLPPWDGTRESLLKGAMGVTPPPAAPAPSGAAQRKGRHVVAAEFTLRQAGVQTVEPNAPAPAYWQPTAPGQDAAVHSVLAAVSPGLYLMGEPFERFYQPLGGGRLIDNVVWERWDTIRHNHYEVDPRAVSGLTRTVSQPMTLTCAAKDLCPATGTWQPWIQPDHSLSTIVNLPWRQAWPQV